MTDHEDNLEQDLVKGQHEGTGYQEIIQERPFQRTNHPSALWFPEAGLGLFVHFGISSVSDHIELSWGMMLTPWDAYYGKYKTTPNEYWQYAERFNPVDYQPDKWLRAAADAGFRYAVLTTRHHDGYALWPSEVSDFGVRTHLNGRDLVQPFVEACRANGLKVGLYYSPPDWHYNREYMSFKLNSTGDAAEYYDADLKPVALNPEPPAGFTDGYHAYIRTQVEELLTWYGKVDLLWFDGGPAAIAMQRIRELQPGIVVNPRMHSYGDFQTPEGEMPQTRPEGWWELCDGWAEKYWGYFEDQHYASLGEMLRRLSKVRGWGGNYLVNCPPGPSGDMASEYYERLAALSAWMEINGEAVFGVQPICPPEEANVPVTARESIRYAFLPYDYGGILRISRISKPTRVAILAGNNGLEYTWQSGILKVDLPCNLHSEDMTIIKIEL